VSALSILVYKKNMRENVIPNFFTPWIHKKQVQKALLTLNLLLAIHFLYRFNEMIEENRYEKLYHLKVDHLQVLGFLLLDYYKNCKELPTELGDVDELQRCITYPIKNHNVTDTYNKPLYYVRTPHGAIASHYANNALFKSETSIDATALYVDTEKMRAQIVVLSSPVMEYCCHWKEPAPVNFTGHPSRPK
tara:strand:- start:67121 stop:67693 length:573 start_codon:yes stop_codon:yes gene_type:complete